jgi:hypothetical protein
MHWTHVNGTPAFRCGFPCLQQWPFCCLLALLGQSQALTSTRQPRAVSGKARHLKHAYVRAYAQTCYFPEHKQSCNHWPLGLCVSILTLPTSGACGDNISWSDSKNPSSGCTEWKDHDCATVFNGYDWGNGRPAKKMTVAGVVCLLLSLWCSCATAQQRENSGAGHPGGLAI